MAEDDDRKRWDEAHRLAKSHHRVLFELPEGADKDDVPLVTWIFRMVQSYRRRTWFWRLLLVQFPLAISAAAAMYGAAIGIHEALQWLTELKK